MPKISAATIRKRAGASRRDKILAKLAAIPAEVKAAIRPVIEAEAAEVVAMQKRLVPKKTGRLAESIRYQMGDVDLASSGNLSAGGAGRSRGSRFKGSAGGVVRGDPDLTATIIAGNREAWYARQVEFGTKPHTIEPKNTQGSLYIGGRWNPPGASVQHPGTRPQPFFYGPFRARKKAATSAVAKAISKAVKAAAAE